MDDKLSGVITRMIAILIAAALVACFPAGRGETAPDSDRVLKTLQRYQAGEMTKPVLAAFSDGSVENPGADLLMIKAWALQFTGRYEEALNVYEEILMADPNRLAARYEKAVCLIELKRTTDSGAEIAEIFKKWPKSLEYMVLKNNNRSKIVTGAKPEFEEEIERFKPVSTAESLLKADWLFASGRSGSALRLYEDLKKALPDSPLPFLREAEILNYRHKYEDAIKVIDKVLALDGNCGAAWRAKGDALAGQGKYAEALSCYNKSEELGVEGAKLFKKRGDLYSVQRSFREALADYTRAVERAPSDYRNFVARYRVYSYLGEQRKAYADLCAATELANDKMPELYYARGMVASSLGFRQDAIKSLEKFLQLVADNDPKRAYAIAMLADLSY
jgi:tetratricopeptide (TPR) repeat protein